MRPNGQVTAVLLLVAFAAVGCSKRSEAPQTKAQETRDSAQATPVAAPGAFDRNDEEGFGEDATAKISGPVSFAARGDDTAFRRSSKDLGR